MPHVHSLPAGDLELAADARWTAFAAAVRAFVRRRTPHSLDPEDIVQDVFLRLTRHRDTLQRVQDLEAWVFRAARSALADALRAQRRREARGSDVEPDSLTVEPEDERHALSELAPCVRAFVLALEEPYGSALRWTAFDGLTQEQAAERAGISLSGMKSRVQRARAKVRTEIEHCCGVHLDRHGILRRQESDDGSSCAAPASFHQIQRLRK
ncbi:MAG: sigma-70 family RNA polymerase sigma factor [Gemmatimonadaceae bacterium]|nr:sigma-70 family RNA polymerase sigma factor [Gemmatimonadaceae bacterium]